MIHSSVGDDEGSAAIVDPLDVYLAEISRVPLLSRDEELECAARLAESRNLYRRDAIGSGGVQRQILEAFRRIAVGDLPLERTVDGAESRTELLDCLPAQVKTLTAALERCESLFFGASRGKAKALDAARAEASAAAESLPFKTVKLLPLLRELERTSARMDDIARQAVVMRSARLTVDADRLTQELRGYRLHMLEDPEELRARVLSVRKHFAAYTEAKAALTRGNLRLVVYIAKMFRGRGVAFLDLIQDGNAGLLRAVDKYDHRLGHKFGTYACWWIRQFVQKAVDGRADVIRAPFNVAKIKMTSLNIGDEDSVLGDEIADARVSPPHEGAENAFLRERIEVAFRFLTHREREIIRLRYGLAGGYTYTLEEVGEIFKVTRERVRQIEKKAMSKLQHPARRAMLAGFLEGATT